MSINIALSGASGKMGKAIGKAAATDPNINIPVKLTREIYNSYNLGQIKQLLLNNTNNISNKLANKIDIFIDFSAPSSCLEYLTICAELQIPIIIGTTGFSDLQREQIIKLAEKTPVLLAPNMSIGANICNYLLANLGKILSSTQQLSKQQDDLKVSIKEIHHKNKKDAPSGTALAMADSIKNNYLAANLDIDFISERHTKAKFFHQVKFCDQLEEIVVQHNVKNRSVFAEGALYAAKWLVQQVKECATINEACRVFSFFDIVGGKL
jgi:4-hydroxy-tetrahydrodipicolinate reductase